jgi:restriction system protein
VVKGVELPKYDNLFKLTLEILTSLGGSAAIEELDDALISRIGASQEQLDVVYPKSGAPVLSDRMSWARSFLKIAGLVTNPRRGIWVLTEEGRNATSKSNAELKQIVSVAYKASVIAKKAAQASSGSGPEQEVGEGTPGWSELLLQRIQNIDATALSASANACCAKVDLPRSRLAASPAMVESMGLAYCASNLSHFKSYSNANDGRVQSVPK